MTTRIKKQDSVSLDLSPVESAALVSSPYKAMYSPVEKIPSLVVEHFPLLGKLTALRFLEWTQDHPEGVITLPTGKTPEYFIKWVLQHWTTKEAQAILQPWGIKRSKPELRGLRFVQID